MGSDSTVSEYLWHCGSNALLQLTEDVVKSLTPPKSNNSGLAFGLPCVGLGIALLIFGLGIGEAEAAWASVFPFFFGMGFIVFWYLEQKGR